MILKKVAQSTNLKETLLGLSSSEIQSMVYDSIFSRGKNYYRNGYVVELEQTSPNLVSAKVEGNYSSYYDIQLSLENHALMGKCNCEYGDICKHIVAVLLKINKEKLIKESITLSKQDQLQNYLETLSKDKLIELVIAYAPESFKQEIIFKDAPKEEQEIHINEIASQIQFDLDDEELLYDPEAFQERVSLYLEQLKSVVNQNPDHVFEVVFDLVDAIESKQDDGYLYCDNYHSEEYFDFDILSVEVMGLIGRIEDSTKQIEFMIQFAKLCSRSSYIGMDYETITIEDKSLLLPYFNNESDLKFYHYIEEYLDFEDKQSYLLAQSPMSSYDLLVELYLTHNQKERAIGYLKSLLSKEFRVEYLDKLLELTKLSTQEMEHYILEILEHDLHRGLKFVIHNIPKTQNPTHFEKLLKAKNLAYYYEYLEKIKRIDEMFALIHKLPIHQMEFFKKYKSHYPQESIRFFSENIKKNLQYTGDNYYQAIADNLKQLQSLISQEELHQMVTKLKAEYKRRRNFVAILERSFKFK